MCVCASASAAAKHLHCVTVFTGWWEGGSMFYDYMTKLGIRTMPLPPFLLVLFLLLPCGPAIGGGLPR